MPTRHYEPQSDIARAWFAKGEAEGEAKVLLQVMALRGFEVSDEIRDRIMCTTDCARIELWASRVLQAKSTAEVLED